MGRGRVRISVIRAWLSSRIPGATLDNVIHNGLVDDFKALISSLGESTVGYIGADNLQSLHVRGHEADGTAFVEICLAENSWDEQSRVIDTMLEIREMFFDELSIEYRFIDEDSSTREAADAHERRSTSYSMA